MVFWKWKGCYSSLYFVSLKLIDFDRLKRFLILFNILKLKYLKNTEERQH